MFLLILGLVVLGPEKLPTVLRKMGRFYGEFKRMTTDAQSDFRQAFAEPLRDLQSAATEYKSVFQDAAGEITDGTKQPDFIPWQPPADANDELNTSITDDEMTATNVLPADDEPEISVISYEDKK